MIIKDYAEKAESYLSTLCSVKPNRRTGSPGNWEATQFFNETIKSFGFQTDVSAFITMDHINNGSNLRIDNNDFEVFTSPYSMGCVVNESIDVVSNVDEVKSSNCEGKILLMMGSICAEQLMPKNFVFYNPEHHKKLISLLESKSPSAIITATAKNPDQVGALYPFPVIVDGDFYIPSVYCRDSVGESLSKLRGKEALLEINASRVPAKAMNVIATLQKASPRKVVLTAHIDAYEDSPGASDNASGTVVLLLVAEMLSDYRGEYCIEIAALNGEDHYSAGGQMDYLKRYHDEFSKINILINIDDVGYKHGETSYSFYNAPDNIETKAKDQFSQFKGICQGEQWFNGDHMIFVQSNVPSIAFTSQQMPELMKTITHTYKDVPEIVDCQKLVQIASALSAFIRLL